MGKIKHPDRNHSDPHTDILNAIRRQQNKKAGDYEQLLHFLQRQNSTLRNELDRTQRELAATELKLSEEKRRNDWRYRKSHTTDE